MLHLLKIDLKKLTNYRTFWVVCGFIFLHSLCYREWYGVFEVAGQLYRGIGQEINISRIPLYHFPDVWQKPRVHQRLIQNCVGDHGGNFNY